MEIGKAIKEAREKKGLSQRQLGEKFGISKNAVSLWETGTNMPDPRKLDELVKILDLDATLLFGAPNTQNESLQAGMTSAMIGHESITLSADSVDVKRAELAPPPLQRSEMPRTVPVLGVVVGGSVGDFSMNDGQPVDFVRETPRIRGRKDVFALYVQNDSMSPWREQGQLVYVEAIKPAQINDYVVIEMKAERGTDERPAFLKRLVGRDFTKLKVKQYNPERTFTIDRLKIHKVYRVIDWSELLGI